MRIRSRVVIIGLLTGLLAAQQSAPVFRAGTKLVEVTVTVLDKKGNSVTGLEPADFTVLDDGKPRTVSMFRFDGVPAAAATSRLSALKLPPGIFSNRLEMEAPDAPRNITALVLDTLNTPAQQSVVARAQMMRYLRAMAPQTRVAIFVMGRQLRILHDFTDDGNALRAKLEKATLGMPNATVSDYSQSIIEAEAFVDMFAGDPQAQAAAEEMMRQSLEVEQMANAQSRRYRLEQSLAAMEALGTHLAGIPGRKNLVWIGGGFSMYSITGNFGMGVHGSTEDYEPKVRATSRKLAQQGIVLYIVDSKGIELPSDQSAASPRPLPVRGRGRFEPQMDTEAAASDPKPAMGLMAQITGGRYLYNTNDLAAGFKQTVTDMQGSYTLGFYMQGDPDDKWHKLKVQVKRSGVSVRNREGYLADSAPAHPVEWTTEMWRSAFFNPLVSTAIPLTVKCERTPSGEVALTLVADPAALIFQPDGQNMAAKLEIGIADRAADGSANTNRFNATVTVTPDKWEAVKRQGVMYQRTWKPAEATTNLRVIVRDVRSGQYGSVAVKL